MVIVESVAGVALVGCYGSVNRLTHVNAHVAIDYGSKWIAAAYCMYINERDRYHDYCVYTSYNYGHARDR